ncbi:hypothetical protein CDAR_4901 [Caerostris darwini]|uniref:Uncharacterized protein n=1 Tax=Caerostris darwini TaxID=1538125 RepID=A0AAV4P3X8_9ARAC|nr:hypothetical protein CDAR_4901 [Caerostris darwini]
MRGFHLTKRAERRETVHLSIASGATFPQDSGSHGNGSFVLIVWRGIPQRGVCVGGGRTNKVLSAVGGHVFSISRFPLNLREILSGISIASNSPCNIASNV